MEHKPITQKVKILMNGVGETDCLECDGLGYWGFGPTEEENGCCVDCKGTGKILVSTY